MLERVSDFAGKVAENVATRRGFCAWLGKGALATVGVVGGLLGLGNVASAVPPNCCGLYKCPDGKGTFTRCFQRKGCPASVSGAGHCKTSSGQAQLIRSSQVGNCKQCG